MSTLLLTHARLLDPEGPTLSGPDGWLLCRDGGIVDRGEASRAFATWGESIGAWFVRSMRASCSVRGCSMRAG